MVTLLCPFQIPWDEGGHVGVYWLQSRVVKGILKMDWLACTGGRRWVPN